MEKSVHELRIEKIAEIIASDNIALDEQDRNNLHKQYCVAIKDGGLAEENAAEQFKEAFLYLKLKEGIDIDPLTKGDQFGAGFS